MKPRITLRDLCWLMAVCALLVGWWLDRSANERLVKENDHLSFTLIGRDSTFELMQAHQKFIHENLKGEARNEFDRVQHEWDVKSLAIEEEIVRRHPR